MLDIDIYLDDFTWPPYIFRVDSPNNEFTEYYGMKKARQLHFLWFTLELVWN